MRLKHTGGGADSLRDGPQHGWLAEAALCGDPIAGETEHTAMVRLRLEAQKEAALRHMEETLTKERNRRNGN